MRAWLLAFTLLLLPASALAQTGPWTAVFPANPDHANQSAGVNIVDRYELVVTPQGGAALAPYSLAKPSPVNGIITVDINTYITTTLKAGTYTSVVRAVGPGGQAVSPPSAPFSLVVAAPGTQAPPTISRSATAPPAPPKH